MSVRRVLMASPFLAGLLGFGVPLCAADESAPPTTSTDWFRGNDNGPTTRDPSHQVDRSSPFDSRRDPDAGRRLPADPNLSGPGNDNDRGLARGRGYEADRRSFAPYNNVTDYPSSDIRDWVFANANAATARAIFRRAEEEVTAAYRRSQVNFERSREYRAALASEKEAYEAFTAERQRALHNLADDSKYRTLLKLRDDLADQLASRRAQKDISKDEILALATLKMNYASDARSMESAALSGDQALADARQKMITASRRCADMRSDHDDSLRDDRQIVAARQYLEDARIGLITAQAYFNGASVAGSVALDYAYYLHRNDVGRWDPYAGYGGGYGSPYWVRY